MATLGRSDFVEGLVRSRADSVVIVAPAGYGKSTLAERLATSSRRRAVCLSSGVAESFALSILEALSVERPERRLAIAESVASSDPGAVVTLALELWSETIEDRSVFIFDNVEIACDHARTATLLAELMRRRPAGRRVVICSRSALPSVLVRHLPPDRTDYVTAHDLCLQTIDIARLLAESGLDEYLADGIFALSNGWPLAVMLIIRLAGEGRFDDGTRATDPPFESLLEHISREYFGTLPAHAFESLIAIGAIPGATVAEVADLQQRNASEIREFLRYCPFVRFESDSKIVAHPLIIALVQKRYADLAGVLLDRAVDEQRVAKRYLRAAELETVRGRPEAAMGDLALYVRTVGVAVARSAETFFGIVREIGVERCIEDPALWLALHNVRRFSAPGERLIAEALRAYCALRPNDSERLRVEVTETYWRLLTNYGRGREVAALIDDSLSYVDDPKLVKRLQVARLAAATHSGAYLPAQQAFRSSDLAAEDPSVYGPLLDFIEATIALRRGSYARGIALLEESVRIVRRSGLISSLQVTLSNIVFEAWLVGDDERFMAALAELRGSLLPGVERAWQFLLDAAASPQTATPTGFEFASVRSIGHLIIAAGVEGSAAVEHAESAVREADAADDIGIRVIARLALAELVPARRATAIEEARALAKRIDLTEVGDGVAAFERHEAGGLYAAFAERRLRRSKRVEPLLVHFAGSRITRDGQAVAVSTVEFALILFLAAARRPVSRTTIQDSLWPDSDEAANGLKVYVHRVRKKLGVDCIARSGDGYVVGPHVSLDLVRAEESLRSAHEKSKGDLRLQLRAIVTEFDTTADSRLQRYDWYESLSRRADELTRAAALHLARTHYDTGAVEFSCLQARFERDPTDEDVCETLIESLLIMNRAPAARRLVERFRLAAERDGDEFSTRRARDFLIRVSAGLREVDRRKVR